MSDRDSELDEAELSDFPGVAAASQFAKMVASVPWFASLGNELDDDEIDWADAYLANLGFPDAHVVLVDGWEDAEAAARNPDWNTEWWEAEEQMRMALIAEACALAGEDRVMVALTNVTNQVSDVAHGAAAVAAAHARVADEALIRAAAGAATQACYQAALVLAAEGDEEHPFALKYRLFENGRWPLSVVGNSFNLF